MRHCPTCACELLSERREFTGIRSYLRVVTDASLVTLILVSLAVLAALALSSRLAAPPTTVHPSGSGALSPPPATVGSAPLAPRSHDRGAVLSEMLDHRDQDISSPRCGVRDVELHGSERTPEDDL